VRKVVELQHELADEGAFLTFDVVSLDESVAYAELIKESPSFMRARREKFPANSLLFLCPLFPATQSSDQSKTPSWIWRRLLSVRSAGRAIR